MNLLYFHDRKPLDDPRLTMACVLGAKRPFDRATKAAELRVQYDRAVELNPKLTLVMINFEPTPKPTPWLTAAPFDAFQNDVIWAAGLVRSWGFTGRIAMFDVPAMYPSLHVNFVSTSGDPWWQIQPSNKQGYPALIKRFKKTAKSWKGIYDVIDALVLQFYIDADEVDPVEWMPACCKVIRTYVDKPLIIALWPREMRNDGARSHTVEKFRRQAEGAKACDPDSVAIWCEPWDKPGRKYVPDTAQVAAAVEVLRGAA
jgi:hypothetical protein